MQENDAMKDDTLQPTTGLGDWLTLAGMGALVVLGAGTLLVLAALGTPEPAGGMVIIGSSG